LTEHPVYIRGKAAHCALGDEVEGMVDAMRGHRANISDIPLSQIGQDYSRPYFRLAGRNGGAGSDAKTDFHDVLYAVVEKAIVNAGLNTAEIERLPIFFGSTCIDIPLYEATYQTASHVLSQTAAGYGNIANDLAVRLGTNGACYTFTTACTSSANGLLFASNLITQGRVDRALVVGYDVFSNVGFFGFEALKLISPLPYKPFDKNRAGIIMGEGCGAVVLDREPAARSDFRCLGGANACDTYSVTTHDPDGGPIAGVMQRALTDAGVAPESVNAVKAHATGSYQNDLTECSGLKRVFEEHVPPVTGLKPFLGHTVGACGVVELILFTEAVKRGFIPPTLGFEEVDAELSIAPITAPLEVSTGNFLLNYFGFGGNCVSLVVSNVHS
jgi:3-oxoacyl-[acyl-carrier-protein] synthase-1